MWYGWAAVACARQVRRPGRLRPLEAGFVKKEVGEALLRDWGRSAELSGARGAQGSSDLPIRGGEAHERLAAGAISCNQYAIRTQSVRNQDAISTQSGIRGDKALLPAPRELERSRPRRRPCLPCDGVGNQKQSDVAPVMAWAIRSNQMSPL